MNSNDMRDKFFCWLAWLLPRRLAYWAAIRVYTWASAHDKLAYREVGTITVQEAIEVWPK